MVWETHGASNPILAADQPAGDPRGPGV